MRFLLLILLVLVAGCGEGNTITGVPAQNQVSAQWWPCGTWAEAVQEGEALHIRIRVDPPCPAWTGLKWRGWD